MSANGSESTENISSRVGEGPEEAHLEDDTMASYSRPSSLHGIESVDSIPGNLSEKQATDQPADNNEEFQDSGAQSFVDDSEFHRDNLLGESKLSVGEADGHRFDQSDATQDSAVGTSALLSFPELDNDVSHLIEARRLSPTSLTLPESEESISEEENAATSGADGSPRTGNRTTPFALSILSSPVSPQDLSGEGESQQTTAEGLQSAELDESNLTERFQRLYQRQEQTDRSQSLHARLDDVRALQQFVTGGTATQLETQMDGNSSEGASAYQGNVPMNGHARLDDVRALQQFVTGGTATQLETQSFIDMQLMNDLDAGHRPLVSPVQDTESLESRLQQHLMTLPQDVFEVRRDRIFIELIETYKTFQDFHKRRLFVKYLDDSRDAEHPFEEGIDLEGLTRDLFSNFWKHDESRSAFNSETVPLTLGYAHGRCPSRCQCVLFGTATFHSFILTRQVPKWLQDHKLTVMGMFCSIGQVTEDFIAEVFETYIQDQTPIVKASLLQCLKVGINDIDADVVNALGEHFRRALPPPKDPKAFKDWLEESVLDVCVYSTSHYVASFRRLLEEALGYSTPSDAVKMFKTLHASSSDVIQLLAVRNDIKDKLSSDQERAFNFLKSFPNTCNQAQLEDFLLFSTGNITLTESYIEVDFYPGKGYPTTSACFNSLHIPTGYTEEEEFHEKMKYVLSNSSNFKFKRE